MQRGCVTIFVDDFHRHLFHINVDAFDASRWAGLSRVGLPNQHGRPKGNPVYSWRCKRKQTYHSILVNHQSLSVLPISPWKLLVQSNIISIWKYLIINFHCHVFIVLPPEVDIDAFDNSISIIMKIEALFFFLGSFSKIYCFDI